MTDPNDIKIEKDVPYSKAEAKRQPAEREPHPLEPKLRALDYGDSFFIADMATKDVSHISRLGDRIGVYLQSKTQKTDGEVAGVRTWRRRLEQLPAKRRERIETKVAAGEFDPEDLSAIREHETREEPAEQVENEAVLYWFHAADNRYYRTHPGDDLTWMRENCTTVSEDDFYNRERFWVYSTGAKPTCTQTPSVAATLEDSRAAEEVTKDEYLEALAAFEQQNPDVSAEPKTIRYFLNIMEDTRIRATPSMADRYLQKPDIFVEISRSEYENEGEGGEAPADDLDDL